MRARVKRVLSRIAYPLGIWWLLFTLNRLLGRTPPLVVFMYHRISDPADPRQFLTPYDLGLDRNLFEQQIVEICRYFDVLGLDTFAEVVTGQKRIHRPSALLTFDDADSEFSENVLPVMRRHRLPGVIFAPVAYIGTDQRIWHLRISNAMMLFNEQTWADVISHSSALPSHIAQIVHSHQTLDRHTRGQAGRELIRILDARPDDEVSSVIATIERYAGPGDPLGIKCMNWEQLKQMHDHGIAVESHTLNHPKLARVDNLILAEELEGSKSCLEKQLGQPIRAICYPQGSYNDRVLDAAAKAGYSLGFTTEDDVCPYPRQGSSLLTIPRKSTQNVDKYDMAFSLGRIAIRQVVGS